MLEIGLRQIKKIKKENLNSNVSIFQILKNWGQRKRQKQKQKKYWTRVVEANNLQIEATHEDYVTNSQIVLPIYNIRALTTMKLTRKDCCDIETLELRFGH